MEKKKTRFGVRVFIFHFLIDHIIRESEKQNFRGKRK